MGKVTLSRSDDGVVLNVVAEGSYTLAEVKAVISAATVNAEPGRDCCLLMDIRRSEASPSTTDLQDFAEFLGDLPTHVAARSAWLVSADLRFGLARMLSIFAEKRGITIEVFRELDAARTWLHAGHREGHAGDRSTGDARPG